MVPILLFVMKKAPNHSGKQQDHRNDPDRQKQLACLDCLHQMFTQEARMHITQPALFIVIRRL